jgi:antitoxin CcdA
MASTAPRAEGPALPPKLVEEASRLGVKIEGRSDEQLRLAVRTAWIEQNRDALKASNAWVEKHGLPLAKYRLF